MKKNLTVFILTMALSVSNSMAIGPQIPNFYHPGFWKQHSIICAEIEAVVPIDDYRVTLKIKLLEILSGEFDGNKGETTEIPVYFSGSGTAIRDLPTTKTVLLIIQHTHKGDRVSTETIRFSPTRNAIIPLRDGLADSSLKTFREIIKKLESEALARDDKKATEDWNRDFRKNLEKKKDDKESEKQ